MSDLINSESDSKAQALEIEIRKLKMELLKHELDDKLLTLRTYMEKKKSLNETTTTLTSDIVEGGRNLEKSILKVKPFESILFANVFGDFEVWHFVLLVLIFWVLLSIKFVKVFYFILERIIISNFLI